MKKTGAALLCYLLLFFSACGGKGQNDGDQTGGGLFRQDPEGLVSISVVDGKGEITLDIDKYDSLYKAYDNKNDFSKGPFKIVTRQDSAIKDAYVGRIRDLSFYESPAPLLFVVLLLENGTIERSEVYPYRSAGDDFYTSGPLPWLNGIVSISAENNTVYAINESGRKYDIYLPAAQPNIGKLDLLLTLTAGSLPDHYGRINFISENGVIYEIWNEDGNWMEYSGYYEMVLHEGHSSGWPPNTLQLFMSLESFDGVLDAAMQNMPHDIEAALSVTVNPSLYNLEMHQISGTNLFGFGGVFQEEYILGQMDGEPTIYPYEMVDYLTGNWELILEGCTLEVYYSNFNRYTRDFTITFLDTETSRYLADMEGGLSSFSDYIYGQEINCLTFNFYGLGFGSGREDETYTIKDLGVHKGRRMMRLAPAQYQSKSIFDQLQLEARYGYADVPLVFGKETSEQRTGRQRLNATFSAVYWEFDSDKNTVWLTEDGLAGDEPSCVSVEYKVNGAEDWQIREAVPGMDCQIRTNAQGEVVEFIVTMG